MGGVLVDRAGESTLPGLFAIGEVASTGLHGANRLASNSLLEAVVCGRWTAAHLRGVLGTENTLPDVADRNWVDATWAAPGPAVQRVREVVTAAAGVLREASGLRAALDELRPLTGDDTGLVGYLVAWSALRREESRGGHSRTDFPDTGPLAAHVLVSRNDLEGELA